MQKLVGHRGEKDADRKTRFAAGMGMGPWYPTMVLGQDHGHGDRVESPQNHFAQPESERERERERERRGGELLEDAVRPLRRIFPSNTTLTGPGFSCHEQA